MGRMARCRVFDCVRMYSSGQTSSAMGGLILFPTCAACCCCCCCCNCCCNCCRCCCWGATARAPRRSTACRRLEQRCVARRCVARQAALIAAAAAAPGTPRVSTACSPKRQPRPIFTHTDCHTDADDHAASSAAALFLSIYRRCTCSSSPHSRYRSCDGDTTRPPASVPMRQKPPMGETWPSHCGWNLAPV